MNPLVTVICLCYNHKSFLRQAIESVLHQTHKNIQVILVDDASTDGSQEELKKLASEHPQVELLLLRQNLGNCKAFNAGWQKAKGDFIVDFSTDDVMLPGHLEKVVAHFQKLDDTFGVVFTDATVVDENGKFIRKHFENLINRKLISSIPQGDIFKDVLTRYFIPGPTMVVRRKVFEVLNGYDENLSYEDFDFWVRSSRQFKYAFLNEREVQIRKLSTSMSANLKKQLHSTYIVCQKAKGLCCDKIEMKALQHRVLYELRHAVIYRDRTHAKLFSQLLRELKFKNWESALLNAVIHFI
jgi:glycosyltransferase involved in cell wall biosynthesis